MLKLIQLSLLFCFLLSVGCSHSEKRGLASSKRDRHLVLMIHGVRGTDMTFGYLPTVIKNHLEKADPTYEVVPVNFLYQTGTANYDPNTLTKEINDQIIKSLGDIRDQDKISVVGYSMGGQVMGHWYLNTIFENREETQKIATHVVNLIGLGAPFWGSKEAEWASDIPGMDYLVSGGLAKMSGNEVRALSVLSNASTQLREKIIRWNSDPAMKARFNPHILSIVGLVPCYGTNQTSEYQPGCGKFKADAFGAANYLFERYFFSGLIRRESDMIAIVPSTRMDFLYYSEKQKGTGNPLNIKKTDFKDIQTDLKTKMITAEAWHAGDGSERLRDLAIVDSNCLEPKNCRHKTYKYLFEQISGCLEPVNRCNQKEFNSLWQGLFDTSVENSQKSRQVVQEDLQGFVIELTIRAPSGYQAPSKTIDKDNLLSYLKFNYGNPNQTLKKDSLSDNLNKFGQRILGQNPEQELIKEGIIPMNGPFQLQIGRETEIASRMVREILDKDGRIMGWKFAVTGRFILGKGYQIDNEAHWNAFLKAIWNNSPTVKFSVNLPGLKSRSIEAPLKPSAYTYIDLTMESSR